MEDLKRDTNLDYINKLYKYMRHGASVEEFMLKFHIKSNELQGILELCRIYGKSIDIVEKNGTIVFEKTQTRTFITTKPDLTQEKLTLTEICVVSDTHFGNIHQQLHLLNQIYQEAYNRGIKIVLHCGDLVDGNYTNRPEQPRQQFLHGFDEQAGYVVDMYPKVEGITTKYILGSHDETHYKNGQATVSNWVSRCRTDMEYLGQDCAAININGVKIFMDHPGGGSAQALSYKPQKRIEILESDFKPKILLIGHYHKSYSFVYRNVRGIEVPCLCDKTQFQQKQGLSNAVGAYFLTIYSDSKGNIQYFEPEEILFRPNDMWDEAGKDKNKVKQLVIK
jgi:predicted phosphodiesterase